MIPIVKPIVEFQNTSQTIKTQICLTNTNFSGNYKVT